MFWQFSVGDAWAGMVGDSASRPPFSHLFTEVLCPVPPRCSRCSRVVVGLRLFIWKTFSFGWIFKSTGHVRRCSTTNRGRSSKERVSSHPSINIEGGNAIEGVAFFFGVDLAEPPGAETGGPRFGLGVIYLTPFRRRTLDSMPVRPLNCGFVMAVNASS